MLETDGKRMCVLERLDEVSAHCQTVQDAVKIIIYLQGGNVKKRLGMGESKRKRHFRTPKSLEIENSTFSLNSQLSSDRVKPYFLMTMMAYCKISNTGLFGLNPSDNKHVFAFTQIFLRNRI